MLFDHPEILRTQLRAILRLSAIHPVSILFPMIGGLDEFLAARQTVQRAQAELRNEHQPFDARIRIGAMIETPSVIQTLKLVIDAAIAEGKPVSICGEIAGNPAYTELLIGLGVRSLSLAPSELLEIKRVVRSLDVAEAGRLAGRALDAGTIGELKACVAGPRPV